MPFCTEVLAEVSFHFLQVQTITCHLLVTYCLTLRLFFLKGLHILVPYAILTMVMVYLLVSKGQCPILVVRCFGEFREPKTKPFVM